MDTVDSKSLPGLWDVDKMLSWMCGKKSTEILQDDQNSTWIKASWMKLTEWLGEYNLKIWDLVILITE